MSTIVYATVSRPKEAEVTTASTLSEGVSNLVELFAGLVPVEVLLLHAAILDLVTETTEATAEAAAVTTITAPGYLRGAFVLLLVFSWLLYVVPRLVSLSKEDEGWEPWDYARMFIPPAAFVVWTLLQKTSAFDALCPNWTGGPRAIVGASVALCLILAANILAFKKPDGEDDAA